MNCVLVVFIGWLLELASLIEDPQRAPNQNSHKPKWVAHRRSSLYLALIDLNKYTITPKCLYPSVLLQFFCSLCCACCAWCCVVLTVLVPFAYSFGFVLTVLASFVLYI